MRSRSWGLLALAVMPLAFPATATSANDTPLGDPIAVPPVEDPTQTPIAGSFVLQSVRTPDPGGGPPWGVGTFLGRSKMGTKRLVVCSVVGRLVQGRLGEMDVAGVFHPYAFGAGADNCGGAGSHRERYPMSSAEDLFSIGPAPECTTADPGTLPVPLPPCDPTTLRTIRTGLMGPSVLRARITLNGRSRPVPVSSEGTYLLVTSGWDRAFFRAPIRIRFSVCGPHARRDLLRWGMGTRSGCVGSTVFAGDGR